ncbi:hypothetical protein LTR86_003112 [Recurvomyces mirabilis]|nr:hypothetical protein LTR86_003112 [Recurvomyces mirabilis]
MQELSVRKVFNNVVAAQLGGGKKIIASRILSSGDLILIDESLCELLISLAEVHDPDQFYTTDARFSGTPAMIRARERMTDVRRAAFDKLHSEDKTTQGIFRSNAFGDDEIRDGQNYHILRVYGKISRINHSCRPNAVVNWNANLGRATVRAITTISSGDEILLDYLGSAEATYQTRRQRRQALQARWNFHCLCAICNAPPAEVRRDNQLRLDAKQLYGSLNDEEQRGAEGNAQDVLNRRIEDGLVYVRAVENLEVRDEKLASAYQHVAALHVKNYEVAKAVDNGHCDECVEEGRPNHHLKRALEMAEASFDTLFLCYGQDHPDTMEQEEVMMGLRRKRAPIRRPSLSF